ncbi:hypothetical protein [Clostridium peptidivorans]|uniref:hypothetical protein n=1 Tax=Clostridium peptidivorans TaxID=100174 RepID=UPI000BE44E86|nr:hypothetical protein [Clostridium peptidivorans]
MKYSCIECKYSPYNRENTICTRCGNYVLSKDCDGTVYAYTNWTPKENTSKEYTLAELINVIKEGVFYVPTTDHRLLKRVYKENNFIQFEFYPNVPQVGLGINENMKFKKID